MAVRLIAGRAGSGKTHFCRSAICEVLASNLCEGPRLIMIVPEQAALQMERAILAASPADVLGRCEVLSFRRLCHRIFSECPGPMPAVMTPTGRNIALRYLIGRHRDELRELGKVADRAGVITAVARSITEFMQEAVEPDALSSAAEQAAEAHDPTAARLHDLALLYRCYREYLGDDRIDPECVIESARDRLEASGLFDGAGVWIDGFAGLTRQQMHMIVEIGRVAAHVDIALLLDPHRGAARDLDAPPDDLSLFARTERTWRSLMHDFNAAGVAIEEPIRLEAAVPPRFAAAPAIAHIEQTLFTADRTLPPTAPDVVLHRAPDRRAEAAAAVRTIVDFVRREIDPLRYRDISIIVRDLEQYHQILSAELAAHGIPFFIDRRRPTHHHPLVQFIRALLAMTSDRTFDRAAVALLKSGLSRIDDAAADAIENCALARGLAGVDLWRGAWPADPLTDAAVDPSLHRTHVVFPPEADAARQALMDKLDKWLAATHGEHRERPCRVWIEELFATLERFHVAARIADRCADAADRNDRDEAAEHEQVWREFVRLLGEMHDILGDAPLDARQFRDALESGLADFKLGLVPATIDQVLVSSIERSRHPSIRAAFVLGFNDGQFPSRPPDDALLGDDERQRLHAAGIELAATPRQQLLDERMLAYIAFTRPGEYLWVSYAERDETGKPLAFSPYWPALKTRVHAGETAISIDKPIDVSSPGRLAGALASRVRSIAGDPELDNSASWMALYEWARAEPAVRHRVRRAMRSLAGSAEAALSRKACKSLWPRPYRTSVSRLERFAKCPFQHYAADGLRLRPRDRHEIAPADLGLLYHRVLEQFVNECNETGTRLGEMSPREIESRLSGMCEQVLPEFTEAMGWQEPDRRSAAWRSRLELPPAVRGQQESLGRTPLHTKMVELSYGPHNDDTLPALRLTLPDGEPLLLSGRIDRVDLLATQGRTLGVVFDYKRSRSRRLRLDEVFHGISLQLMTYLFVLQAHGDKLADTPIEPCGAFYIPLLAGLERVSHPDEADANDFLPYKEYKPRGVIDFDWIDTIDPAMQAGNESDAFAVKRKQDGAISRIDSSDALAGEDLRRLLKHVRHCIIDLAEQWTQGVISVKPVLIGPYTPCADCRFRSVCRMEYDTRDVRRLPNMKRTEVIDRLGEQGASDHG